MPRYRFLEIKTPNAQNNERFKKRHSPSLFFDLFTLWTINACFAVFNGYLQYFKQITITTISSRKTYAREQYKLPLEVAEHSHSQMSSRKTHYKEQCKLPLEVPYQNHSQKSSRKTHYGEQCKMALKVGEQITARRAV